DTYDGAEDYFREGGGKLTVARTNSSDTGAPTDLASALGVLSKDLGPGQVFAPGDMGSASGAHDGLLDHAGATNPLARLTPHTATAGDKAALEALSASLKTSENARYGALFAPQVVIPGVTSGTTRTVDAPAMVAGLMARNDALFGPNDPAAGVHGISRF